MIKYKDFLKNTTFARASHSQNNTVHVFRSGSSISIQEDVQCVMMWYSYIHALDHQVNEKRLREEVFVKFIQRLYLISLEGAAEAGDLSTLG
jgi:hypothetical protein